jgi:protein arginine N-methyltransferase 5
MYCGDSLSTFLTCGQDPLYLPPDSELHVDIWRLTDRRKVWYEWSAQSFLAIPQIQPNDLLRSISPFVQASGEDVGSESDSKQSLKVQTNSSMVESVSQHLASEDSPTLVKIGQTALHNPCGRSSWIGL